MYDNINHSNAFFTVKQKQTAADFHQHVQHSSHDTLGSVWTQSFSEFRRSVLVDEQKTFLMNIWMILKEILRRCNKRSRLELYRT